jgi:hypothetical protein
MSPFPRSRFASLRRKSFYRNFSLFIRNVLVIGLAALLFLAPLSFPVSAQESSPSSKSVQTKRFTIYQDANGEVVCRAATLAERNQFERVDTSNQGLHQINHLKGISNEISHSANAQAGANAGTGLTIILRATTQLQNNAAANAAFIRAAQNWESLIMSPVTVYIDVDFGTTNFGRAWDANVLGSTGTPSRSYLYQSVRANMIAEANSEGNATKQAIFNALPSANVPTDLGNGSRMDVADSIARAIGLLPATALSGDSASQIAFNSNFNYDFDPSDGITSGLTDFDAVATHEIGHALGFDSDAGLELSRPSIWDLYRFRTGTTSGTFTSAPRVMTIGGSPDALQFDFIPGNTELGLSTGGPSGSTTNGGDGWQSSHWRHSSFSNGVAYIGIMDPAIASGIRRQITANDILALTSFGYNLTNSVTPPAAPPAPPTPAPPANDNFVNAQVIIGCSGSVAGTNESATKEAGEVSNPDSPASTKSVWYQWQAPSTGSVTINTRGSDFDTVLAVYTGSTFGTLNLVVNNDDIVSGEIIPSSVTFDATQGTVYLIAVNGYNNPGSGGGEIGNIKLNLTQAGCTQTTPLVQLSQSTNTVSEDAGHVNVTVTRTDSTGTAAVTYATSDTAGLTNCNVINGIASSRCDYATSVGTLHFAAGEASKTISIPVVDDNFSEGNETFTLTLSNPVGATLGSTTATTITITDNANTSGNPIDVVPFFVRQNYIDFLGREPDSFGNKGWQDMLNNCAAGDITCDRIEVSSRFFRSAEFQERGYYVYRFYSASLGRKPNYEEFIPDVAKVSGFLTDAEKEANKAAFADEFVLRTEFRNRYDSQVTPTDYVNALLTTAGLLNHPSKAGWIAGLTNGSLTRAQVLRQLAESQQLGDKYFVEAFVVMQYFGYLRRNPDSFYKDWIAIMNQDPNNYRNMVNGFMNSTEYRARFAP